MNGDDDQHILDFCRPLEPIPTGQTPRLQQLPSIRAVLFDIYGTVLISTSGDFHAEADSREAEAFQSALEATGVTGLTSSETGLEIYRQAIVDDHLQCKRNGIEFPEVDIIEIWQRALSELNERGLVTGIPGNLDWVRLAIEYEIRVNPVWPMPELGKCLGQLKSRNVTLGIISNSQIVTVKVFSALMQASPNELGFDPQLQFYSFQHRRAKPGLDLYRLAADALAGIGIADSETLYVGNDMLNDVLPAQTTGFRTALFAGDARSLRFRDGDSRVAGCEPDIVITDLLQLLDCIP